MAWLGMALAVGCGKKAGSGAEESSAPQDPQVEANLSQLTHELRRAMVGNKLSGSFEEFTNIRHLDAPPPPAGKKYAISKKWKVILVDAQ